MISLNENFAACVTMDRKILILKTNDCSVFKEIAITNVDDDFVANHIKQIKKDLWIVSGVERNPDLLFGDDEEDWEAYPKNSYLLYQDIIEQEANFANHKVYNEFSSVTKYRELMPQFEYLYIQET